MNPFGDRGLGLERFGRNMRNVRALDEGRGITYEIDFGQRRSAQQQLQQQQQQQLN